MSKITIVGVSGSGKTCYMIGMFTKMMQGFNGFSLTPDRDFPKFLRWSKRLADKSLSFQERFPALSDQVENYSFSLKYNFKEIDKIDWIDYPGGILSLDETNSDNIKFFENLKDTDCLFLCIDGAAFIEDDVASNISVEKGGFETNYVLERAASINEELPNTCIIITKYDKVPESKRNNKYLTDVVTEVFPNLFNKNDNGYNRIVTICPVTLGKEIEMPGGKLEPKQIEKPIAFATYFMQLYRLLAIENRVSGLNEALENYSGNFVKKWWNSSEIGTTAKEIEAYKNVYTSMLKDLAVLKSEVSALPLYINGQKTDWSKI